MSCHSFNEERGLTSQILMALVVSAMDTRVTKAIGVVEGDRCDVQG